MDCHKKIKEKHYGLKSLIQNGFSNKEPLLQLKATIEFMGNNKIAHYSWAEKKKIVGLEILNISYHVAFYIRRYSCVPVGTFSIRL